MFHDWGWNQLAAQDPRVASAIKSSNTLSDRLKALTQLDAKHKFFYTLDKAYLGENLNSIGGTWGPWALEEYWEPVRPDPKLVSRKFLSLSGEERLRGLDAFYNSDDVTTFEIHHYYANQYFSAGRWLREKGDGEDGLRCFEMGLPFYPRAAYAYAYMGAIVGSEGYLELARRLCLLGIDADPGYFGSYENLANVYRIQIFWSF